MVLVVDGVAFDSMYVAGSSHRLYVIGKEEEGQTAGKYHHALGRIWVTAQAERIITGVWIISNLVGIDDLYEGTYWRFCVDKAAASNAIHRLATTSRR